MTTIAATSTAEIPLGVLRGSRMTFKKMAGYQSPAPAIYFGVGLVCFLIGLFWGINDVGDAVVHGTDMPVLGLLGSMLFGIVGVAGVVQNVRMSTALSGSGGEVQRYEDGLTITRGKRVLTVRYAELEGLALGVWDNVDERGIGTGKSYLFKLRLPQKTLHLSHTGTGTTREEIEEFAAALLAGATEAARRRLASGGSLSGFLWTFDGATLRRTFPKLEIAASEVGESRRADRKVKLYGSGSSTLLALSEEDMNARVLHELFSSKVPATAGAASGLGRRLLSDTLGLSSIGTAVFFGICGIVIALSSAKGPLDTTAYVLRACLLLAGLGAFGYAVNRFIHRVYLHERGVVERRINGTRTLLFNDVDLFAFHSQRNLVSVNGGPASYRDTLFRATFESRSRGISIELSRTITGSTDDLNAVRDALAARLGKEIVDAVRSGKKELLGITDTLQIVSLTKDGLVCESATGGAATTLPYDVGMRISMNEGLCTITNAEGMTLKGIAMNGPNFYPALAALGALTSPAA